MRLYKYRSLIGDGLLYALDMILNNRIYFATRHEMNDPHEGSYSQFNQPFTLESHSKNRDIWNKVDNIINKTRFTCFSLIPDNPLLWAHYAGGYSGITIEYDIPENSDNFDLLPIDYSGKPELKKEELQKIINNEKKIYEFGILRRKKEEWEYEEEYRLYQKHNDNKYLNDIKPSSVIIGTNEALHKDVFEEICYKLEIRIGYLIPKEKGYKIFYPDKD